MSVLLTNALLVDIDPPQVQRGSLRLAGGRIAARGPHVTPEAGDEVVDCGGAVVLPGMVNGHTHLYSALAVGMPPPERSPRNFPEILQFVWWRLDQGLDGRSIATSARIGALEAVRCGTTTLIDHHASPRAIEGSLDGVESGIAEVGLRGVLCYETTDRHGLTGRNVGIEENRRYLAKCKSIAGGRFAGLVGAHASFTLADDALEALAGLAAEFGVGVHIHVAEDVCDEADARARGHASLIARLQRCGVMGSESVFAHTTHLDAAAAAAVREAGLIVAHNARSNMNNAVGYAPTGLLAGVMMLGTDGIGADMFAEARAAWLAGQDHRAGLAPADIVAMLAHSARRASRSLGLTLGKLQVDAAADVVLTDYVPFTPLTHDNVPGHLLFGIDANRVRHVLANGEWVLRNGAAVKVDAGQARREAEVVAKQLWERMAAIPLPS
jgi:putative selenium metabolism protein SsnA